MEFIISNKKIKNASRYGNVYHIGGIINDNLVILEGEFASFDSDEVMNADIDYILNENHEGIYNYIKYDKDTNIVYCKNDRLGKMLVYFYFKDGIFIISNCFWHIIKNIEDRDIEIDDYKLKEHLFFQSVIHESRTYFKNIQILSPSTILKIELNKNKYEINKYWDFCYRENSDLSYNEAVEKLDNDFYAIFEDIKKRNPNSTFGFGNSGGLDSRLIAYYSKEVGIPILGYTIGNTKPNGVTYSTSFKNAHQIAKIIGIKTYDIQYGSKDYATRLDLSVRNNPFGGNQILKNAIDEIPNFDTLITGQQGALVGGSAFGYFDDDDDYDLLHNQIFNFLSEGRMNLIEEKNKYFKYIKKAYNKLNVSKGKYDKEKKGIYKKSIVDHLFTEEDIINFHESIDKLILGMNNKSSQNIRWSVYHNILAQKDYSGGFETFNRTKKTYYIYGQYNLDNILNWKLDYIHNRKVLKQLIINKSMELSKISGQDMESIIGEQSRIEQLIKTMEFFSRFGHGLDYYNWIKDENLQLFIFSVLERENPLFSEVFDIKKIQKLQIYNYLYILKILQLKRILDIIYYKEYELIDDERFLIK